jgi:lipopolysaccharide transport protein LptA
MKTWVATLLLIAGLTAAPWRGPAAPSPSPSAAPQKKPTKQENKPEDKTVDKSPLNLFGEKGSPSNEPTVTEIYSDEAFFDSAKSMGIFSGHVKVTDPRFNLQSDKLTVFISKGENQGLEKAVAEGSVGVVRDRPDPNGGPPTRAVGRGDIATYIAATGNVELKGTPRVQQGENTHIATSPDTVMLINQSGQLTTHGPSRTEIKQQPKDETKDDGKEDKKGDAKSPAKPEKSPSPKK